MWDIKNQIKKISKRYIEKVDILFLLKTSIGSAMAIFIARYFGFLYSASAGIITLLTIQNTKKETINITLKRLVSFAVMVATTYAVFSLMGYTPMAFGVFIFIFVAISNIFNIKEAISMNAVLATHFLAEGRMDLPLLYNEIYILLIGMIIGIGLNMIMPRNNEKIRKAQIELEEMFREILSCMAYSLEGREQDILPCKRYYNENVISFNRINSFLNDLYDKAYENYNNTLLSNTKYILKYIALRKSQVKILEAINKHIDRVPTVIDQTYPITRFILKISKDFHEYNHAIELLKELNDLKEDYRNQDLPKTRIEFESRAILFQILNDLEHFLLLKREFIE